MQFKPTLILVAVLLMAPILTACQPVLLDPAQAESSLPSAEDDPGVISAANVHLFPADAENEVPGAASTLVRKADGVEITVDTVDLEPGHAYTLWWVIFNQPESCGAGGCVAPDLANPATEAMVNYASGEIADEDGRATFRATLDTGDAAGALDNASGFPFKLVEPAPGLLEPMTADIHAVIRTHGEALADPQEQLTSFNGGCNPACDNVQATMHLPLLADTMPGEILTDAAIVHQFPAEETNNVDGTLSMLQRTPAGVTVEIETVGLTPGDAYTLWWVVFNHPGECSDGGCIPQDFIEAKVASMVKYGTGAIAREDGSATFRAFLPLGEVTGALDNGSGFPWALVEPAPGLIEPMEAEIHLVIRTHGAAMENPTEQLATFNGGCNPACVNVQAVMHLPGS